MSSAVRLTVFSSVQSLSRVQLFATPWIAAHQASLSITNSQSSLKLMSVELVVPSLHLILCRPLFLLPPIPPSIRVFSNESTLCMWWPNYWSFSFSIIPSRKISISALLTMPKPLTVWITISCGKFWKRREYQIIQPASWEICMQVRKQQLELDMKQQTGSK